MLTAEPVTRRQLSLGDRTRRRCTGTIVVLVERYEVSESSLKRLLRAAGKDLRHADWQPVGPLVWQLTRR